MIQFSVISHANCTDGTMAAFWYYLHFKSINRLEQVEFIFMQYNQDIPVFKGSELIVVDFSFTKEQLEHENFKNKNIRILDHHESSAIGHGGYGLHGNKCCGNTSFFTALFEKDKSGCGLAMEDVLFNTNEFFEDNLDRLKYVSDRIQDRDLWKFEFEDTKDVYELMNSIPKTFEAWEKLLINTSTEEFNKQLMVMKIRTEMRLELAQQYANIATIVPYGDKTIAIINCASNFASEVGNILGKQHAFAVMFIVVPKDKIVIASLRSNTDTGENVSLVAKKFGGGGHVNAAGFSFNYEQEPDKLLKLTTGELFN